MYRCGLIVLLLASVCRAQEALTIESEVLGERRVARVVVPESYERTQRNYPLILVLDGEHQLDTMTEVAEYLASAGAIPESIIVGLDNTQRERDFTPPDMRLPGVPTAAADRFLSFVADELLPRIEREYRIGAAGGIIGHSHGGLAVVYALTTHPELFAWGLALDAPAHLEDGWATSAMLARLDDGTRPLVFVSCETRFGFRGHEWEQIERAKREGDRLLRLRVDDESHETMPLLGAYLGLRGMFAPFREAGSMASPSAAQVESAYSALSVLFGEAVSPSAGSLMTYLEDALMEGRGEDARAFLRAYVGQHGEPTSYGTLCQRVDDAVAVGPMDETVADLLATPHATPEQVAPFVGRWEGTMSTAGGRAVGVMLEVRPINGCSEGQLVLDGEVEQREPLTLLRVVADGTLEVGYMNGMRPRGMLVYALHRDGEVLRGDMQLRGVRFSMPGGRTIPPTTIEMRRVGS